MYQWHIRTYEFIVIGWMRIKSNLSFEHSRYVLVHLEQYWKYFRLTIINIAINSAIFLAWVGINWMMSQEQWLWIECLSRVTVIGSDISPHFLFIVPTAVYNYHYYNQLSHSNTRKIAYYACSPESRFRHNTLNFHAKIIQTTWNHFISFYLQFKFAFVFIRQFSRKSLHLHAFIQNFSFQI